MKLRAMISRFEDTRDLRLMGGYQPELMGPWIRPSTSSPDCTRPSSRGPDDPACIDAFQEIARALSEGRDESAKQPARA